MSTARPAYNGSKAAPSVDRVLDQLLIHHIKKGAQVLILRPGKAVEIMGGATELQAVETHVTPAALVRSMCRLLVAESMYKPAKEVLESDIRQLVGGVMDRDVILELEGRTIVRRVQARLLPQQERVYGLEFTVEPPFLAGYGSLVEPLSAPSEEALMAWLDDFLTRLFRALPRVKDVIFSPNKPCPMVTLPGGLKEVEDVRLTGGGRMTERLAMGLVNHARSPHITEALEANGGHLRRLDLDLSYRTAKGRRCRVNIADSLDVDLDHGPLITMRLLSERPWTLEDLPLPRPVLDASIELSMGLILVAGPTGSGKSTTMGALIDNLLRRKSVNLLTIENPVETVFPPDRYPRSIISQRELGKHAANLQRGLESAVRQTLDLAMVGEIRNALDASLSLELAKAGHLIFATVHAGTSEEAIDRIVDMYPPDQEKRVRLMLASQLKMVMAQRLIRGLDGGPTLVLEFVRTCPDIQERILREQDVGKELSLRELIEGPKVRFGRSLDQALVRLLEEGRISEDMVMFNSPDPGALLLRQNKLGVRFSGRWDPTGALIDEDMEANLGLQAAVLGETDFR